jgi:hypothetical protein
MGYYSITPLIRTLVIRIGLAIRIGTYVPELHYIFYALNFSPICQMHIRNYVLMFYLYVNKYVT